VRSQNHQQLGAVIDVKASAQDLLFAAHRFSSAIETLVRNCEAFPTPAHRARRHPRHRAGIRNASQDETFASLNGWMVRQPRWRNQSSSHYERARPDGARSKLPPPRI